MNGDRDEGVLPGVAVFNASSQTRGKESWSEDYKLNKNKSPG